MQPTRLTSTRTQRRPRRSRQASAAAFTLVELLVALGLISLIMLMFAQVFQIATGSMTTHRGAMENDQRARTITTVITNDLQNRSLRTLIPFQPGETDYVNSVPYSFSRRRGYFSISENSPSSTLDDVLSFTMLITDPAAEPMYGKATALPAGGPNITAHPNQPEADDLQINANSTAKSTKAEVVYFLRNGNLYRRVLLIREPLDESSYDRQPLNSSGENFFNLDPAAGPDTYYPATGTNNFWNDFDFSATLGLRYDTSSMTWIIQGARFIGGGAAGVNPLDNSGGSLFPVAIPSNRFGHDSNPGDRAINRHGASTDPNSSLGNPREYVGSLFIGRFTHEETSHADFNYPHTNSTAGDGNPMNPVGTPLTDANNDSVVDEFAGGPRRGEDILLTNVHAFDVQVWDERVGNFVDVGHSIAYTDPNVDRGDFHQERNRRPTYGPQAASNNNFDTWHPGFNANGIGGVNYEDTAPYLPKQNYAVTAVWGATATYTVAPTTLVKPTNVNASESFVFRCVGTTTGAGSGARGSTEPNWPSFAGGRVVDGELIWEAVYNLRRVRSIRITVRYLDVTSDQLRQVTLIQSLLD